MAVHRIHRNTLKGSFNERVLNVYEFEVANVLALESFVNFARTTLRCASALRIKAGLQDIKGCKLGGHVRESAGAFKPGVEWEGELAPSETNYAAFLRPYFVKVWAAFAFDRFPEADQTLADNLRM